MQFQDMESAQALNEAERAAWINGGTDKAALLAKLSDDADELERLRAFYHDVRRFYPLHSSKKKAEFVEAMLGIWECVEDAGEVNE